MHAGVAEVDAIDRASRDGVRAKIAFGLVATFGGHHLDQSGAALGRLRRGAEQRVADGGYAAGLLGIAGGHGHPVDPSAGLEAAVLAAIAVLHLLPLRYGPAAVPFLRENRRAYTVADRPNRAGTRCSGGRRDGA